MLKERINQWIETAKFVSDAYISDNLKRSVWLNGFALFKIPVVAFLLPRVVHGDENEIQILIPFGYRSKNHIGSMYLGALCAGADLAVGFPMFEIIQQSGHPIELSFRSLKADFLKRAHSDVVFTFKEISLLSEMVEQALQSKERVSKVFSILATCGAEPVAQFEIELSLKTKTKRAE